MNELNELLIEIEKQVIYLKDRINTTDKKYSKLLGFVKKTVSYQTDSYFIFEPDYVQNLLDEAEKLLKEIGE